MLTIRRKDKVLVRSGKDRGKTGEVVRVFPAENRAIVRGLNLVVRHRRGTPQKPGGRQSMEAPIPLARLRLICPKCEKVTRPRFKVLADGTKERFCHRCGEQIL